MNICVFGASSDELAREYYEAAFRLGELLAGEGHTLVYGGGRGGLMGACAAGVLSRGGHTLGVAPRYFDEGDVLLKERGEFVFTDTMAERKALMTERADAFVVLPGGTGTMDEFFEVLTLKQLGQLAKPIVLLSTLGFYDALYSLLRGMTEQGFAGEGLMKLFCLCAAPEEALACVKEPQAPLARGIGDYNR